MQLKNSLQQQALITGLLMLVGGHSYGQQNCEQGQDALAPKNCLRPYLEEVVVTGTRTDKRVMESPVTISVIGKEDIQRSTSFTVADMMRDVPGVDVADSGQPGLMRIQIRGDESRRTAILIDGQEITDHHEVGVPLTLDPSMVERIDIMRGSGSVLYGSKAISGVVNFVTRKGGTRPLQASVSVTGDTASSASSVFGSIYGNVSGFEYRLAANTAKQGNRQTPAGELDNTASEHSSAYVYLGKQLGDHRIELVYDNYRSSNEVHVPEDERNNPPLIDFAIDVPRRDREKLALFYTGEDFAPFLPRIAFNVYSQISDRQFDTFPTLQLGPMLTERSIFTSSELDSRGADLQLDWLPGEKHYLVSGIEYNSDRINQDRHTKTVINNGLPISTEIHDKAHIDTLAAYAQDEWEFLPDTRLTFGARHYWVEGELERTDRAGLAPSKQTDQHTVGSVALSYAGIDGLMLRANAAQGYLYPSLLQLATGAYAGSRYVNPNPDLKPETSDTFELGARVQMAGWVYDGALYYSRAEDYIDHVFCSAADSCLGSRDKKYVNVGSSRGWGFENYLAYNWRTLTPYASLTWMRRIHKFEDYTTSETRTPAFMGRAGLRFDQPVREGLGVWTDFYLRGESASDEFDGVESEHNAGWGTVNFAAGVLLGDEGQYQFTFEFLNLANREYSTASENLLAAERSVRARLDLSF